jgi:hypothetical protein
MANTMSKADLVASLKDSLHDAAKVFVASDPATPDAEFERFLLQALPDMQMKRPVTKLGSVTLTANFPRYSLGSVAGFAAFKTQLWGDTCKLKPWEPGYPGAVPRVSASYDAGQWWLDFDPAPTDKAIGVWGSKFDFWYFGAHVIGADAADTTINAQDRGLLILRAQVEAMRELGIRNAGKPVSMRDGFSGQPRNGHAAVIWKDLLAHFNGTTV